MSKNPLGSVKTPSLKEIAKKHKVSMAYICKQAAKGTKVEKEHTKSNKTASEIARDHLNERPDYYERLEKVEGNLKEDASTFSGTSGIGGLGYFGDLAGVDDATDDYRGTNMMSYEDENGNLLTYMQRLHRALHNKLGFKSYNPTKIKSLTNFYKKKKPLDEQKENKETGMNLKELFDTPKGKERGKEYVRRAGLQMYQHGRNDSDDIRTQRDIEAKPKFDEKSRDGGKLRWVHGKVTKSRAATDRKMSNRIKYVPKALDKLVKEEEMNMTEAVRDKLVKHLDKLKAKAWQQSYTPRLADKNMRQPDLFQQGPKYPGDEAVMRGVSAHNRTREKVEKVTAILNRHPSKDGKKSGISNSDMAKYKSWGPGLKKEEVSLEEGNKENKLKKKKLMKPKHKAFRNMTKHSAFDPRRMLSAHNKKAAHDAAAVHEETNMDRKEIINEAIVNIIEGNHNKMQEQIRSVLQEKAIEKLDERKKEIAATYFAEVK